MDMNYFGKKWAYPFTFLRESTDVTICKSFEIEYEADFTFENLFERVSIIGLGSGRIESPVKGFWILEGRGLVQLDIAKGIFQPQMDDNNEERLLKNLRIRGVIADQASLLLYDPRIALEELLTCSNRNIRESAARLLS